MWAAPKWTGSRMPHPIASRRTQSTASSASSDWDRDHVLFVARSRALKAARWPRARPPPTTTGISTSLKSSTLARTKSDQQVTFNANVTDVAGDIVSGGTSIIVHQSQLYGGIRSLSYVGKQGQAQPFEVAVLDWDSNPVAGPERDGEVRGAPVVQRAEAGSAGTVELGHFGQGNARGPEDGCHRTRTARRRSRSSRPHGGVYKAIVTVTDSKGQYAAGFGLYLGLEQSIHRLAADATTAPSI